jgi:BRCA1-associated protein
LEEKKKKRVKKVGFSIFFSSKGKVVELPSPFQKTDYREPEKIQKVVTEYNFLLLSQLEAQRAYFEDLVEKARLESAGPGETELAHEVKRLNKVLAQQTQQLNQIKDKMLAVMRENQFLKEVNAAQESDRARWETVLQKHAAERAAAAEQMREMQDQLRDLMFFVEAQKAVQAQDGALEEGGVVKISKQAVPPPVKTPGSGNKKNKKKK